MGQPIDTASVQIVADLSGFETKLKAGIDAALRGLSSDLSSAFGRIEELASRAGLEIGRDFQRGGETAEAALREVSNQARRSMGQVEESASAAGTAVSTRLGGALAFVRMSLLTAGAAAAAGLGAMTVFGLKAAAGIEQTQVAFDSLLGSATEGKRVFDSLRQFAAVTPFELSEITPLAQKFLAFSANVGLSKDQLQEFLTTVGNVASVTGGGAQALNSVGLAFSHISSGGKVSLEDINILSDALPGFSGVAAIAAATGKSTGDAMTAISAGAIDATTGVNALLKGMNNFPGAAGAMEKQSQTLLGVFSTFKDVVGQALSGAFAPAIPAIKDALSELTPILGDAIGQLAPALGAGLAAILPFLGRLVKAIVPILTPLLNALGPALDALGPALQPLGEALGQVLVALAPALPVLTEFVIVLVQLAVPVLLLLAQILKPLTPLLNFMALAIAEVSRALAMIDWAGVGHSISDFAKAAWSVIADFFVGVGNWFAALPKAVNDAGTSMRDKLIGYFRDVIDFALSLPGRLISAIGDTLSALVDTGKNLVRGLWNGISAMGSWLWGMVTDFVQRNTVGAAKHILGISSPSAVFAAEVGSQIPAGIAMGVRSGMSELTGLLAPIVPGGTSAPAAPMSAGAGLGNIIVNVMFAGVVPTPQEAKRTGQAAGEGVLSALQRSAIGLAVRTA